MAEQQLVQIENHRDRTAVLERKRAFHVMTKPIGPICNLDCTYCYYLEKQKLFGSGEQFRMADTLLEQYIRQFIDAQDRDEIQMAWQGGEPTLLGIPFFERAIAIQSRYASGKRITNALQTNGTLITEEWASFLDANKFLVGISIDGPADLHDKYRVNKHQRPTFDAVMRGLDLIKAHGVEFNTLTVVSRANQDHALRTYHFLKEIGSQYMQFIPLVERAPDAVARGLGLDHAAPPTIGSEDADVSNAALVTPWSVGAEKYGQFLTTIFDDWVRNDVGRIFVQMFDLALAQWVDGRAGLCVFEKTCGDSLVIEHNGDLYSCDHYVYPQYKLGNIQDTPLSDLASTAQQHKFGNDKRDTLTEFCRQCDVRFACNGDCPKHRFALTPNGEAGLSYLCPSYLHFFRTTLPYVRTMGELLRANRPPAEIMNLVRLSDVKAADERRQRRTKSIWKSAKRNDPCPCGSGRKYKQCCLGGRQ